MRQLTMIAKLFCLATGFMTSLSFAYGPVAKTQIFLQHTQPTQKDKAAQREELVGFHLALPLPVGLENLTPLPIAQIKYLDSTSANEDASLTRRRTGTGYFGLGIIHHAAEGAPRWYSEIGRLGAKNSPGVRGLLGVNLMQLPGIEPGITTSDNEIWASIEVIRVGKKTFLLPIISFEPDAPQGFHVQIAAPKEFYILYKPNRLKTRWRAGLNIETDYSNDTSFVPGTFEKVAASEQMPEDLLWLERTRIQWLMGAQFAAFYPRLAFDATVGAEAMQACIIGAEDSSITHRSCPGKSWRQYQPFARLALELKTKS